MTLFAIGVVIAMFALWTMQLVIALKYAATFRHSRPAEVSDELLPKMGVHFPLRGADPHLAPALRSLLNQDYPDFELRIIIDSREDPAWDLVHEILRQHQESESKIDDGMALPNRRPSGCSRVHVTTLREKRRTCSLIGRKLPGCSLSQSSTTLVPTGRLCRCRHGRSATLAAREMARPPWSILRSARRWAIVGTLPRRRPGARWSATYGTSGRWCRCGCSIFLGAAPASCACPNCAARGWRQTVGPRHGRQRHAD